MPTRIPPTPTAAVQEPSKPSSAPGCRGLITYGDPHGSWEPLLLAVAADPPDGVIIVGDLELEVPLRQQVAPLLSAGVQVFWIPGNHDARSADAYDGLWGDHPDGNLHACCVAVGGIRVAGLGGVFKGRVWRPGAEPVHRSRAGYLAQLPRTDRWRGGLPLRARDAIFPEDLDVVSRLRADVLVSHEAPSCHRHGHAVVDAAAQACGARLVVHGHHHHDYEGVIGSGVRVRGLDRAEVFRIRREDLL